MDQMSEDIFGKALLDFQAGNPTEDIITHSSLEETDIMPLPHLFRDLKDMPEIERKALKSCFGKVLDIGCGAGSHSLYLQQSGLDVTAIDISRGAVEVCRQRGVKKVIQTHIMDYSDKEFDTLLMLMNGVGIVGTLKGLDAFLRHALSLLRPGGCILLDSSDIIYMFETEQGNYILPADKTYYGEVRFTMSYKHEKSSPFDWLYLDFNTLEESAERNGYRCEVLLEGDHYDYLAKLSPFI